jgi:hypothetical protein
VAGVRRCGFFEVPAGPLFWRPRLTAAMNSSESTDLLDAWEERPNPISSRRLAATKNRQEAEFGRARRRGAVCAIGFYEARRNEVLMALESLGRALNPRPPKPPTP